MFKKFKEIATAWIAASNPTPQQKATAEYRISVCNACEHRKQNSDIIDFHYCGLCGCPLSKKIFASDKISCPENKWLK